MDLFAPDEVRPKEAMRFAYVREQGFDRSCGFSVAASLLSLYWSLPVSEDDLLRRYASGKLESGRLDVNFQDLAGLFADYGFSVKGVRMGWDQLSSALGRYAPIIVHYARPDRHFALALEIRDGWIITLDPAMGCELMPRGQFLERWSGAALIAFLPGATRDEGLLERAIRSEWDRHGLSERLLR